MRALLLAVLALLATATSAQTSDWATPSEQSGYRTTPDYAATMAYLRRHCPRVNFVGIMGADNLATIDRWQRWREIFTMVPVVVVDRPGWRLKALASKAARAFATARLPETEAAGLAHRPAPAWTFLTGPLSHMSSTAWRNRGRRNQVSC